MNVLVSACLMGMECRYDGFECFIEEMNTLKEKCNLIPVCPEIYGGLKTPREPAEIQDERILTKTGQDVTKEYHRGANQIEKLAKFYQCSYAVLKERSPSCGYGRIYDGTFSGKLIDGNGILADLLAKRGILIFGETRIHDFLSLLDQIQPEAAF